MHIIYSIVINTYIFTVYISLLLSYTFNTILWKIVLNKTTPTNEVVTLNTSISDSLIANLLIQVAPIIPYTTICFFLWLTIYPYIRQVLSAEIIPIETEIAIMVLYEVSSSLFFISNSSIV